jgi:hypothetical protein
VETFGGWSGPGRLPGRETSSGPSARHGHSGGELGLTWDRVVEETVEDLAVIHQSTGSQVPQVIMAEGLIGIVIREIDDRSVIAGTDLA